MTIVANEQIDQLLSKVRKPSRYIGGEINSACKPWDSAKVRWALVFPDVYEIGMSHIGLQIIYDILNKESETLADRAFAPWVDMEAAMRELNVPLWGLETRRSLRDFDIIGITLPYELTYTNILTILDLAGIPFLASERGDEFPLIIGGGVGAFNPEPVAPFFDAIVLGDGEDVAVEISQKFNELVGEGLCPLPKKKKLLQSISRIRGVYVPKLPPLKKGGEGGFNDTPFGVQKSTVPDINKIPYPTQWVVPYMNVVHDRVGVEIQRGCVRGCRFCHAGYIYRPVRQRLPDKIEELADCGLQSTGHEDISFLSLSAGDYEDLPGILKNVAEKHAKLWTNISLPSLRVETLTKDVLDVLSRTNPPSTPFPPHNRRTGAKGGRGGFKGGFTLAPEAGTERLRQIINKGNTEKDLIDTIEKIFATGWRQLKLYFMIGLPTETEEDVKAIAELSHKALNTGKKFRRDATITVSISTFVPKPHTPFQWARQISINETLAKQDMLKNLLRRRGMELKWHDARISFLEGVFSRGDRTLANVIVAAWKNGARFDAWDEQLKFDAWKGAFESSNVKPETYLKERSLDDALPWDHLFVELDRDFLRREYEQALKASPTPDCINNKCTHCGVCDFKMVKNEVCHCELPEGAKQSPVYNYVQEIATPPSEASATQPADRRNDMRLTFSFTKLGPARWLSHLELMQVFRRAFRRAGLPVAYSQGFHPHMKLSLEKALKVGEASERENGKVELTNTTDISSFIEKLVLSEGIRILDHSITGLLSGTAGSKVSIQL